jgi:formate dehydrogenase major subunit
MVPHRLLPDGVPKMNARETNRRQFFRGTGLTIGGLAGLGLDLKPAAAAVPKLKILGAREVPTVCPYCAVGCGQIASVRDGQIVNIEGNPDSPINRGTLCPKGSAAFQLAVNPNRLTKVKYRAPYATDWVEKPLDWAMDRIAERVKATRDATFTETWTGKGQDGQEVEKRVNHCATIASLGGATLDNEWNYAHLKLWRALGLIWLENQARI